MLLMIVFFRSLFCFTPPPFCWNAKCSVVGQNSVLTEIIAIRIYFFFHFLIPNQILRRNEQIN